MATASPSAFSKHSSNAFKSGGAMRNDGMAERKYSVISDSAGKEHSKAPMSRRHVTAACFNFTSAAEQPSGITARKRRSLGQTSRAIRSAKNSPPAVRHKRGKHSNVRRWTAGDANARALANDGHTMCTVGKSNDIDPSTIPSLSASETAYTPVAKHSIATTPHRKSLWSTSGAAALQAAHATLVTVCNRRCLSQISTEPKAVQEASHTTFKMRRKTRTHSG